jgi:hypothetical protein
VIANSIKTRKVTENCRLKENAWKRKHFLVILWDWLVMIQRPLQTTIMTKAGMASIQPPSDTPYGIGIPNFQKSIFLKVAKRPIPVGIGTPADHLSIA